MSISSIALLMLIVLNTGFHRCDLLPVSTDTDSIKVRDRHVVQQYFRTFKMMVNVYSKFHNSFSETPGIPDEFTVIAIGFRCRPIESSCSLRSSQMNSLPAAQMSPGPLGGASIG